MSKRINIIVASRNPVKVEAVRNAFSAQFPSAELGVTGIDVASGVSDQPDSDAETQSGALNRVAAARDQQPNADYWVGLEGGIESNCEQLMAFAWMAVEDRNGRVGTARTVTLPLPPAVKELIDSGMELGEANDRVFSTLNSKQGGGAFGLLTNGLHTRESVYAQAVTIALIPFVNELFSESDSLQ